MAKTEPLVLTKEQAEAIQTLNRLSGGKDEVLKQKALGRVWGRDLACIDSLSLDELARALYVGYEIEKTQEERYEDVREAYLDSIGHANFEERDAILLTLDLLGITIEGVNG
ncbi:hypothetical protein [Shouchella rhizosphaerae]|uniref:Uncharacterized protein n=1 Tax=Shouchella rhizosphaerae TaxID=866786 RepID=A0ABZ2CYF5_9BACI